MPPRDELPECLAKIREPFCRACRGRGGVSEPCPPEDGACTATPSLPHWLEDLDEDAPRQIEEYLTRNREKACSRCLLLLLLHAINRLVPAEELPIWLDEPNLDLGRRSPRACISEKDYDPVFRALCLRNAAGPVS